MKDLDALELVLNLIEDELGYSANTETTLKDANVKNQVILDNWNSVRDIRTNSPFFKNLFNEDFQAIGQEFQFYYDLRIDLTVYSENEVRSIEIKNKVAELFNKFEDSPQDFHEDVILFEVGDGGRRDPMFEPSAMRYYKATQALHLKFVDKQEITSEEVLEEIKKEVEIK